MRRLTAFLTDRARKGWRFHTIFEQDKNTVIVIERRTQ